MKKLLIILCLVFFVGCASNSSFILSRNQVQLGNTKLDLWKLYGYKTGHSNVIPEFAMQPIYEHENDKCKNTVYRYWLKSKGNVSPYLLTFQGCRLPNYDEIQKEMQLRLKPIRSNPKMQKEIDVFCKENNLLPENREDVELMLAYSPEMPPIYMAESTLISIKLDENF